MEVRCPSCTQRLRYSDALTNPLLRCRTCNHTFRPAEILRQEEPAVAELIEIERWNEPVYEATTAYDNPTTNEPPVTTTRPSIAGSAAGSAARGLGTVAVVLMVIALKAGPRLAREFFQEKKQPDPPVQMPDPVQLQRQQQQMMDQAFKKIAAEQAARDGGEPLKPVRKFERDW